MSKIDINSVTSSSGFKTHRNYIIVILIVAILFSLRECVHQKNVDEMINDIATYSDSAKYYKGKHGEVIAYNSLLKVQNDDQLRAILSSNKQIADELKNFKSIKEVTTIKNNFYLHDTIKLPANSIPCDFKPFPLRKSNKDFTFKGTLSTKDFVIDSLFIPNETNIIIGKRKTGFLKYEEQVVVKNSNPYITTTNVSNVSVKYEKKWWEKGWVKVVGGFILGYGGATAQQQALSK
jgi:hypothetical protein